MDKEEEETAEDKNDMVGREEGQGNDHIKKRWVPLLGDTHEETVN